MITGKPSGSRAFFTACQRCAQSARSSTGTFLILAKIQQ